MQSGAPVAEVRQRKLRLRLLVAGALAALTLSACATNDRDDLASYVDQLHSDAAEGQLLASQSAQGKVPVIFVWLHSAELSHHILELREHLAGAVAEPGLTSQVSAAKLIADSIGAALGELHSHANDRSAAASVGAQLTSAADHAESLYESLQ